MRSLDPTLSAGRVSDLYADVVNLVNVKPDSTFEVFSKEMTSALERMYGTGWLINSNISRDVVMQVLYSSVEVPDVPKVTEDSAWCDGSICKFATCASTEIPIGKTFYFRDNEGSEQGFNFVTNSKKPETILINFSDELSIEIDQTGRLLYPAHYFDNLFLEEEKSTILEMPQNISKGRAYVIAPSSEMLEECRYLKLNALSSLALDKEKKILQFGEQIGEDNFEIVSGFVLSFSKNKLVNAWLKVENISA